jgi:Plasmid pRiA4b ORF-3-like protein
VTDLLSEIAEDPILPHQDTPSRGRRIHIGQVGAGTDLSATWATLPSDRQPFRLDGWEHDVVLEKRLYPDPEARLPVCIAGKGACPPEDCGGPWGYADLKDTLADLGDDDHDRMLDWLGLECAEEFDPAAFDLTEINEVLDLTVAARR